MEATITPKRRKVIDIPEDVFKYLSIKAAASGTNLKKYIEALLAKEVEDIDDSETYKYLCETRPEGNILLNEKETREFMNWLEVKER